MFKVLRYLTFVFGGLIGILIAYGFGQVTSLELSKDVLVSIYAVFAIIFGIIFYLLFPVIIKKLTDLRMLEKKLRKLQLQILLVQLLDF